MYKASKSDVMRLQEWGKQDEYISKLMASGAQPPIHRTAYFAPSQQNWSWEIGLIQHGGRTYELLTRFDLVEGGRQINLVEY